MTLIKIYMGIMLVIFMLVAMLGLIPVILGLWDELKDYMKDRKNNE